MKDVVITEAFTGYPDGRTERAFAPSSDPISVPNEFAEMIVEKGHAKWPRGATKSATTTEPARATAGGAAAPKNHGEDE